MNTENSVRERYSKAAKAVEPKLCCPVDYDRKYLEVIPKHVIEKDYGCGDPSKYVKEGETVLDLGSGTGKICFIASQVVGSKGRVIGVDMNDDMLEIARDASGEVAKKIGYKNVEFRKGKIQDLKTDREAVDQFLKKNPINNENDLQNYEEWIQTSSQENPLIADNSVDVVVSNCVLNLVSDENKKKLFKEIFRVLKRGGRAVISDIVSDEPVTEKMKNDPELWSGCISGAFEELGFLKAFEEAGFYGAQILKRDESPWQTIEGIEFRSVTVEAFKGKEGECWEHLESVIYKGPFKAVTDDDGHRFRRGERSAVCRKTFEILGREPYSSFFEKISPHTEISSKEATPFDCTPRVRDPRETKGKNFNLTQKSAENCC